MQRGDLDLQAGTLSIQRQVVVVGGVRHVQPPKSASRRTVHLPEPALEVLRGYLAGQPLAMSTAALFTRPDGAALDHHHLRASWNRARAAVGRPDLHLHDLRHGGLTLVAMTGVTLREIMGHAGHSTVAASMNYQHLAESRGAEIATRLGRLGERADPSRAARRAVSERYWHSYGTGTRCRYSQGLRRGCTARASVQVRDLQTH